MHEKLCLKLDTRQVCVTCIILLQLIVIFYTPAVQNCSEYGTCMVVGEDVVLFLAHED